MDPEGNVVIEIVGEGKTELGDVSGLHQPEEPNRGVLPILVHKLCQRPKRMRVKRYPFAQLQGKGFLRKVKFAKRQAYYNRSDAAVMVVDSEGPRVELRRKLRDLQQGRDAELSDFPMAVGVAHPCIEAWLLADATAVRRAMHLPNNPPVPEKPEQLPAPCQDKTNNPKYTLFQLVLDAGGKKMDVHDKDHIANAMNDMEVICMRCPEGFAPFAEEVNERIRPLFSGSETSP